MQVFIQFQTNVMMLDLSEKKKKEYILYKIVKGFRAYNKSLLKHSKFPI